MEITAGVGWCWNAQLECRNTRAVFSVYSDKIRPSGVMCLIPGASAEKGNGFLDGLQRKVVRMIEGLEKNTYEGRLKETCLAPTSCATFDKSPQL